MEKKWLASNIETEIAGYPETGRYMVVNNSDQPQTTVVTDGEGREHTVALDANGSKWFDFDGNEI
jgi:1,3-beta-galactosyl-N-acetylhexosamine phosphorylase